MKYCPQCQTTYTDDLLKYCLKDGAPLGEVFGSQIPPASSANEENTVASIRQVEPIRIPIQQNPPPVEIPPVQNPPVQYSPAPQRQPVEAPVVAMQTDGRKPKTGLTVALTVLATLLLLGIGGIIWLTYFRNQESAVAVNANKAPTANRPANQNAANVQKANQANQIANQNTNANLNAATPTATATPRQPLEPERAEAVAAEVENTIDEWRSATENLDIGGQLSQYAETVNYYKGGRVSRARIRADKDRALGLYNSININISNLKVTPGDSGENATALFDKEWDFRGERNNSSGKVQQQLTLSRIDGKWLITGERDLRVYYVNK